jgi:5-methylthioadenosine/S-adenosylhomocysteine deaminase
MQSADLLVEHALIVTQNEQRRVIEDGAVAVRGPVIAAVGAAADLGADYRPARIIDASGQALFAGLVNTHLFQSAVKGLGEDVGVEKSIQAVTFPTSVTMTPDEVYLLSLVSCLENLRSGVTEAVDFIYPVGDPALHEAVIRAMLASGLRGRYSHMVNNDGAAAGIVPALIQPADEALAHAAELLSRYPGRRGGRA